MEGRKQFCIVPRGYSSLLGLNNIPTGEGWEFSSFCKEGIYGALEVTGYYLYTNVLLNLNHTILSF